MALEKYNEKRNFKQTQEPEGKVNKENKLRFVVQKHIATRLHFDFRIEHNGVLLSWAVPKGVPQTSKEKHLAMAVEDHPVSYYDFEGTIPEGNYGAGTVMVWDLGTYTVPGLTDKDDIRKAINDGLEKGDLKLELQGKKLKGIFALVRFKRAGDNAWLFIKDKDEYEPLVIKDPDISAKTGKTMEEIEKSNKVWDSDKKKVVKKELPDRITLPMLASIADEPFDNEDWIFEPKLDGYRAIAVLQDGSVELFSRNQISLNNKYPEVVEYLEKLNINAVLDGEIIVLNKKKIPEFQLLQNYSLDKEGTLQYALFDLLSLDNLDLRQLPLLERKKALEALSKKAKFPKNVFVNEFSKTKGKALFKEMIKEGYEGVVAKKADGRYLSGERSDQWKKFKSAKEMECLICGYTEPQGNRKHFGSLLLGRIKYGKLQYIGNTGSGFNDANLEEIKDLLDKHKVKESPFEDNSSVPKKSVFVEPKIVAEVKFAEVTSEGMLRQAIFQKIREDKDPKDINVSENMKVEKDSKEEKIDDPLTLVTHPEKLYWPDDKYTKLDLAKFYLEISDFILPYLKGRPQNMNRHPDGIKGGSFYHKDYEQSHPDFVKTYGIYSESSQREVDYIICDNVETLIFLANLGCIEMNPWVSTIEHIDNPDYLIFDLDPNDVPFPETVKVALKIHDLLDKIEVDNYLKTSGKRGLHINIPLGAKYTYDNSRDFSEIVAIWLMKQLPDLISLERSPDKRKGKVYIDYLQNRKGQTTASVYSVRPVEKASVSTPIKWSEVTSKLNPKDYTIKTLAKRLDKVGDLWKPVLGKGINLEKAVKNLQKYLA